MHGSSRSSYFDPCWVSHLLSGMSSPNMEPPIVLLEKRKPGTSNKRTLKSKEPSFQRDLMNYKGKECMQSRMNAIVKLVQATVMQPDNLDILIDGFAKIAAVMDKKIKSGQALTSAKERIRSNEFIEKFASYFDELSITEMNYIADSFNSEPMKKYQKIGLKLGPFTQAIREAVLVTSENI